MSISGWVLRNLVLLTVAVADVLVHPRNRFHNQDRSQRRSGMLRSEHEVDDAARSLHNAVSFLQTGTSATSGDDMDDIEEDLAGNPGGMTAMAKNELDDGLGDDDDDNDSVSYFHGEEDQSSLQPKAWQHVPKDAAPLWDAESSPSPSETESQSDMEIDSIPSTVSNGEDVGTQGQAEDSSSIPNPGIAVLKALEPLGPLAQERAVRHGLRWVENYLEPPDRLMDMGTNGIKIFWEVAVSAEKPGLARYAEKTARRLAKTFCQTHSPQHLLTKEDMLDAFEAVALFKDLHMENDICATKMARRVFQLGKASKDASEYLNDPNSLSPRGLYRLANADDNTGKEEAKLADVVSAVYTLYRAKSYFPKKIKLNPHMDLIWRTLRLRNYRNARADYDFPGGDDEDQPFVEQAYNVLNLPVMDSNDGEDELAKNHVDWIVPFLKVNFPHVIARRDVELTGLFTDVLRQVGEKDMAMAGTAFLLRAQRQDGSWHAIHFSDGLQNQKGPPSDSYSAVFPTWCAINGLLTRKKHLPGMYARAFLREVEEPLEEVNKSHKEEDQGPSWQ